MSYTLPNRASIHPTQSFHPQLTTLEVDGIAIVGTSNGHGYHFQIFLYNRALSCSVSFDCHPTYDADDPDKARVTIDFKPYTWTKSQNASSGQTPPSTDAFEVKLKASTKVWKIFNVLFDTLKRDQYRFTGGLGCRHWCAIILGDLEAQGYISSSATMKFESWERTKYTEFGAAIFFLPRIQGNFYD
ncbi:uncharacterized protein BT62DRAFT_1011754 [Guyanagaster necrorhizus]|uniref:DUF7770 domain-containing protein n=1 Tax=Guyanagaster necrorhizus TaxID=856835 RepID=A0A9P7VJZ4_9AGAR|nr:uncharacterized protein BT62DRAFT_1011754 [Guyanagaster necrorhizus MCA 3950]KAG7441329.1 hypothetical protein BT62DRAFT_1011754 [Guyanagaster necrorhizus MCA 3950]